MATKSDLPIAALRIHDRMSYQITSERRSEVEAGRKAHLFSADRGFRTGDL